MAMLLRTGSPAGRHPASAGAAPALSRAALSGLAARLLTPLRLAQGRTAVGTVMVTRPAALPQLMGGPEAARPAGWTVQMLGARELALGAGTWLALRRAARDGDPRPARLWLAAGALSDAVDALVTARALGSGAVKAVPGAALVTVASTAAAAQVAALADDDRLLGRAPA